MAIAIRLLSALFVACLLSENTSGQVDNGPATLAGALTLQPNQCATLYLSAFYEDNCKIPTQGGPSDAVNLSPCDSHCRCFHGAKWGQCIPRPANGAVGVRFGLSNQMCACYYSDPPTPVSNPLDIAMCPGWEILDSAANFCDFGQVNATAGACSSDCFCAHGFPKGGYCDSERQLCICNQ